MRLTKRVLDAAQYEGGTDYRWDEVLPGFGARVYPSGKKSFVVSYRLHGRKKIMVLGKYGVLTLDQARKKARAALVSAADGADPSSARQALRVAPTVADLADRYLEEHARPKKKTKSVEEDERMLAQRILPAIGTLKVMAVDRNDIATLHARLHETPYLANRVLALLSKAFNLAETWGWRDPGSNPCRHVDHYPERNRERHLSAEEISRLGEVLGEVEQERSALPGAIAVVRLLLLTGCRLREIMHLRWEDVDFERSCLHLPDSKTGRRTVHIGSAALDVLTHIEREKGNPWVIRGARRGQHLVNPTKPWHRIRERAGLSDVRLHDLRHTYASFGAGAGFSLLLIGKMLGHRNASTTQRYAHLAASPVRQAVEAVGSDIAAAMQRGLSARVGEAGKGRPVNMQVRGTPSTAGSSRS